MNPFNVRILGHSFCIWGSTDIPGTDEKNTGMSIILLIHMASKIDENVFAPLSMTASERRFRHVLESFREAVGLAPRLCNESNRKVENLSSNESLKLSPGVATGYPDIPAATMFQNAQLDASQVLAAIRNVKKSWSMPRNNSSVDICLTVPLAPLANGVIILMMLIYSPVITCSWTSK